MTVEEMVQKVLEENFGMDVEKIPECQSKTPDYYARNGEEKYLIEVKEKQSNPEVLAGREAALSNGKIFQIAESIQPKSVLENIVRSGKRQISSFAGDDECFRIVWIHCSGLSYDAVREQIVAGLYGSETVADWGKEDGFAGTCYYFNESQFFKYRNEIDAVIISCKNSEVQCCLNDHSPRYSQLKESSLAKTFGEGLVDPVESERLGNAFVVDGAVDRRNSDEVLSFLQGKYETDRLKVMPMEHFEAHTSLPDKPM